MVRNPEYTTVAVKHATRGLIKAEAENTGLKMWALVDQMAANYFNQRGNV